MSQFIEMFEDHNYTSVPLAELIDKSFPGEWGTEDENGNGTKVIRTTNITNSDKLDLSDVVTRNIVAAKLQKKQLCGGDILLERSGGTKDNPVGRVAYFDEDGVFVTNNFTQTLRCNNNIESRYLFYFLYYFYNLNKMKIRSMGNQTTGIQNLNMDDYMQISVIVPPRDLQKQFISIVTQADKSKFVGFKSQFIEMFEGDKYPSVKLSDIASEWLKGQSFRKDDIVDNGNSMCIHYGELFTKYGPIINQVLSRTNVEGKRTSKVGDILFPASDVTPNGLARCSMLPYDNIILGGDIIVLRPKRDCNAAYLSYAINQQTAQLLIRVNGAVVKHMSAKALMTVVIPMPPLEEQNRFVSLAQQADKSKYFS